MVSVFIILLSTFTFLSALFLEDSVYLTTVPSISITLETVDNVALAFFTLEYVVRLLCAPNLKKFLFNLMNLADLMAILPFLVSIIVEELQVRTTIIPD